MKTEFHKNPYLWAAAALFFTVTFLNINAIGTEKAVIYTTSYVIESIALLAFYSWLFWRAGRDSK